VRGGNPREEKFVAMEMEHLIKMANEIGGFFEQMPDRSEAVNSIATHLRNFWEPRMRRQIIDHVEHGGGELKQIVRDAVLTLKRPKPG
jgi:formate dehydrogenase subunit delta